MKNQPDEEPFMALRVSVVTGQYRVIISDLVLKLRRNGCTSRREDKHIRFTHDSFQALNR